MIRYVAGFYFTQHPGNGVILIHKRRGPQHIVGRLNGIGGHIEPSDASPSHAMAREFKEEAGVETAPERWAHFCTLEGKDFTVHFFRADQLPGERPTQETDEALQLVWPDDLPRHHLTGIPPLTANVHWLLEMAHVRQSHNWPFKVVEGKPL